MTTGEPLATFVHVTDTHITDSAESLDAFVDLINGEAFFPLPDLVVHTGDLISGYKPSEELYAQMGLAKGALDRLQAPWLACCHNHDTHGETVRGTVFQDVFQVPYVQEAQVGGVYFLLFSGAVERAETYGGIATDAQEPERMDIDTPTGLKVLHDRLSQQPVERIKCVFSHKPLFNPRQEPSLSDPNEAMPRRSGCGYGYSEEKAAPVRRAFEQHGVTAYYCGHVHLNARYDANDVTYLVTSALRNYPGEFRHVSVYADRMVHRIFGVPQGRELPMRWSSCLIDADHPTPEDYFAGLPWEREFEIPCHSGVGSTSD